MSYSSQPPKETEGSPEEAHNCPGEEGAEEAVENRDPLKVKSGVQKRAAGFIPTIVCFTRGVNGEQPEAITSLSLNSSYGLWVTSSNDKKKKENANKMASDK